MSDLRERIARAVAGYMMTTEASEFSTFAMADAVLDALDLEQVGWRVRDDGPATTRGAFRHHPSADTEPVYRLGGSHE